MLGWQTISGTFLLIARAEPGGAASPVGVVITDGIIVEEQPFMGDRLGTKGPSLSAEVQEMWNGLLCRGYNP